MKIITLILIFLINLLYAENIEFYNPSFNCDNVKKDSVEYKICTDEVLSLQDSTLTNNYNSLIKLTKLNINKIKEEQKNWLVIRNNCKDYKCIKTTYEERIKKLNYIYELFTKNDFLPLERIKVANPDEVNENVTLKYHFGCKSNGKPQIIARDKDFYFIETFSKHNDYNKDKEWSFDFWVSSYYIDETTNEQIFKGTLFFEDGFTFQPTAIEFFTYSKNWDCELTTDKY